MNLYEYQAKQLFADTGISVPRSCLAETAEELDKCVADTGVPCMLKAQVLRGGRGKAGLIQQADEAHEAVAKGKKLFDQCPGMRGVLVEGKLSIDRELYLSMTIDPVNACVTAMASGRGGVDIETLAAESPDEIVREPINVFHGFMPFNTRNLITPLGLPKDVGEAVGKLAANLFQLARRSDATLVEINPLIVTGDGTCVAADGKITIDNNALYRQPFEHTLDEYVNDIEYAAAREGIPYVQLDGDIGLMCAGAGLTNTVSDLIHDFGGRPANFLEFGGPHYRRARKAMELTLMNRPKVILVVTFGTIARADVMAEGVAEAIKALKPNIPIVTAIRGTGEDEAHNILRAAGLEPLTDTEEAVKKAVALASAKGEAGTTAQ
ncbi:MAG: acetate--CoA ligase family protein [Candidatus Pacebacteria bacterium]|nr:acetate--CoA ligase family protein [Candidatus Paceibacterota bacterium]